MKTIKKIGFAVMPVLFFSVCAAQESDYLTVCASSSYSISSLEDAGEATYRWLENGVVIPNATSASYVNAGGRGDIGTYVYVRQAYTASCGWQSSNGYMVLVVNTPGTCTFTMGTAPGATATFADPRDGKSYKIVRMPDGKAWFAQNLNYTKDLVFNQTSATPTTSTSNGAGSIGSYWCPAIEGNTRSTDPNMCDVYGALYTWETAMMVDGRCANDTKLSCGTSTWSEPATSTYLSGAATATNGDRNQARGTVTAKSGGRGICPMGWHVPTELEWATMLNAVDGTSVFTAQTGTGWVGTNSPGVKLKSAGTYSSETVADGRWAANSGTNGTNTTGFGAVPAGYRNYNGSQFYNRGIGAIYWSSSVGNATNAWSRQFAYNYAQVYRALYNRSYGFSVRCVRD
jgi:uncharacterized protein (TIGR02145 family)